MTDTLRPAPDDARIMHATSVALDAHGVPRDSLVVSLVFGSFARSDAAALSDVDLLHLCWPESGLHELQFLRLHDPAGQIDTNVIRIDRLEQCFDDPTWSYRFYRARPIQHTNSRPMAEILSWLCEFNDLIASPRACWHRANVNLEHLMQLTKLMVRTPPREMLRCFLLSEIGHLAPFIVLELARHVPFSTRRYPTDEALALEQQSDAVINYKRFLSTMRAVRVAGSNDQGMDFASPKRAQQLRRFLRRAIEQEYAAALGKGYLYLLSGDDSRVHDVTAVLSRIDSLRCTVPNDVVAALEDLCGACADELDSTRATVPEWSRRDVRAESGRQRGRRELCEGVLPWNALWPPALSVAVHGS